MVTRSLTVVKSRWEGELEWENNVVIYRHWDGDLGGHGAWLAEFLDDIVVVNGIQIGRAPKRYANGPGRLAAMLVTKLQQDGHNPDLLGKVTACGQEYQYELYVQYGHSGGSIRVIVLDEPMTAFGKECTNEIFNGTVDEYQTWIETQCTANKV